MCLIRIKYTLNSIYTDARIKFTLEGLSLTFSTTPLLHYLGSWQQNTEWGVFFKDFEYFKIDIQLF